MREILFRGKGKNSGNWFYGGYCEINNSVCIIEKKGLYVGIIPETIGQFTGLCDRHGRKIFEGDIIRAIHYKEELNTSYINFEDGIYWCELITGSFIECCETLFEQHCECGLEVIGNIHDNPEMLGGEENATD